MLRSGGVTLEQLTDVCKDISDGKREVLASMVTAAVEAKPSKINHPFQVREAPSISINIKVSQYWLITAIGDSLASIW